jgi:hypothetical protein
MSAYSAAAANDWLLGAMSDYSAAATMTNHSATVTDYFVTVTNYSPRGPTTIRVQQLLFFQLMIDGHAMSRSCKQSGFAHTYASP